MPLRVVSHPMEPSLNPGNRPRRRSVAGLAMAAASALLAVGCSGETSTSSSSTSTGPSTTAATTSTNPAGTAVELTVHGACGAQFWAATAEGDVALRITLDEVDRSTSEATTLDVAVPDPAVTIEVLRGRDLTRNFCTDALDSTSNPTSTEPATAGSGQIVVAAAEPNCGTLNGSVSLTNLATADGTTFSALSFEASGPVCYGG